MLLSIPSMRWFHGLFVLCIVGVVVTFFIVIQPLYNISFQSQTIIRLKSLSLSQRNNLRLVRLHQQYDLLLNLSAFKMGSLTNKTMIYSCQRSCGGLGDRLRGIVSVFILSRLLNRRFMIDMNYPCPVTQALLPNLVDWTYAPHSQSNNRSRLTISEVPVWPIKTEISMAHIITYHDFLTIWSTYEEIWISTNGDFVAPAFRNRFASNASQMLLGRFPLAEATMETLFPLIFDFLFKPTVSVQNGVEQILVESRRRHLICLHIRIGKNPSNPSDRAFPSRINTAEDMLKFVDKYSMNISKPLVFVTSDSSEAVGTVLRHFPKSSMTVVGPILHVDKANGQASVIANGFVKVIADFYLLGECQTSILSRSGFSALANRRRKVPNENLYFYDENSRTIRKG
ncbi:MAG: hypothetical protein IT281_10640 [Ignavibacteria bacterium]|nr:hypothetical protein [Ignavibacteria bacterium]